MITDNRIHNTIEIAAPLAKVREAVTTTEGFRAWWTVDTDLDHAAREATYTFVRAKDTMAATFKLDRLDDRGIAMTCVREHNTAEWLGTKLELDLEPTATGTRVTLVHAGYPAKNEFYDQCTKGWAYFLGSLDKYVTTGTGTPHGKA